jgi:predicted amino acid racemase
VEGAKAAERAIGRQLEIISGGSSINMLLLKDGKNSMPSRINHLRIGGFIANPVNMRLGRGYTMQGMREDCMELVAEIVEIKEKDSAPHGSSARNWAGKPVTFVDKGRRMRAILAVGGQDIDDYTALIARDTGIELVGGSSDHTILDVTDSPREWRTGDTVAFGLRYAAMLHAFSGKHVRIEYVNDDAEAGV